MKPLHAKSTVLSLIKAHATISFWPYYQIRHATFSKQIVVEKLLSGIAVKKEYLPLSPDGIKEAMMLIEEWRNPTSPTTDKCEGKSE